jgi:hypothetical protein
MSNLQNDLKEEIKELYSDWQLSTYADIDFDYAKDEEDFIKHAIIDLEKTFSKDFAENKIEFNTKEIIKLLENEIEDDQVERRELAALNY